MITVYDFNNLFPRTGAAASFNETHNSIPQSLGGESIKKQVQAKKKSEPQVPLSAGPNEITCNSINEKCVVKVHGLQCQQKPLD